MSPMFAKLLGVATGTGPHALGGDGTTVKQTGTDFGPSQRFTADMGSGATTMNLTTGQSGNPASRWYLDQFPLWLHGETLAMEAPAQHTLRLLP
jgi:penicillin amidase